MKRALNALPVLFWALLPITAAAATSPSPAASPSPVLAPTLDRVLLGPPSGYAPIPTTNPANGHFTAHQWGLTYGAKAVEAERLLNQYGFVDGYSMTWAIQKPLRVINEFVLAFQGGKGASQWFAYDRIADTSLPLYQHADTLSGIPQYFGVNETESSVNGQAYADGFVFSKGNDVLGVLVVSLTNDNLGAATTQAKSQYAVAPASTIPPAQWPENANAQASVAAATPGGGGGVALPYLLFGGAAAVAIVLGAALLLMRTRRPPVVATPAAPVENVPASGMAVAPASLPLQMSADGNFWYDGERWVDAGQEAPPFAPRSPDGAFWWDGYGWRPAPLAQPPLSGR